MKEDPAIIERLLKSYDLILDFYGIVVADKDSGLLKRGDNWEAQFQNLNTHSHNYLRITRILKCLGEFGFEHYKKPFLEFFIVEIWENKTLKNCANSCRNYWIGTIKSDEHRRQLEEKMQSYYPNEEKPKHVPVGFLHSSSDEDDDFKELRRRVGDL